jgi:methylated-DNA-[protein]-cysteine S-methyltransferase
METMAILRNNASLEIIGGYKVIYFSTMESPIDELLFLSEGEALSCLHMIEGKQKMEIDSAWKRDDKLPIFKAVREQLESYFAGELKDFDVPMQMHGTEFQLKVWNELCNIPYGTTINYGQLAHRIGNPNAQRAVGLANGRNPIAVIVPCHRVIGANGTLTGYGGGLSRKEILLKLEGRASLKVEQLALLTAG